MRKLEAVLTERLSLKDPRFFLQKAGGWLVGNIVSPSFRGKGDYQRQQMIWKALEAEFGATASALVGNLLAYTPEEWDLGADDAEAPSRKRKVG